MIGEQQALSPDSLRAALDRVFSGSEYNWEAPPNPLAFLADLLNRIVRWLEALYDAHPVAYVVFLGVLTLVLIAILVHLGYLVWRALHPQTTPSSGPSAAAAPARDARWHLAEAARLARIGSYSEALAHRFFALVLELDARTMLAFHPSKTPAEYLGEVRLDASGRAVFAELVAALYRHLFAGAPCNQSQLQWFEHEASALGGIIAAE